MSWGGFWLIVEAKLSQESLLEEIVYVDKTALKHVPGGD